MMRVARVAVFVAAAVTIAACGGEPSPAPAPGGAGAPPPPPRGPAVARPAPPGRAAPHAPSTAPIEVRELALLDAWDGDAAAVRALSLRLTAAGAEAVPVLRDALASADDRIGDGAVEAARLLPAEALPALLERLDDADARFRLRVVRALAAIGDWWASGPDRAAIEARIAEGLAAAPTEERLVRLRAIADAAVVRPAGFWRPEIAGQAPADGVLPHVAALLASASGDELGAVARVLGVCGSAARPSAGALRERFDSLPAGTRDEAWSPTRRALSFAIERIGPESPTVPVAIAAELAAPEITDLRREAVLWWLESWGADAEPAVAGLLAWGRASGPESLRSLTRVLAAIPGAEDRMAGHVIETIAARTAPVRGDLHGIQELGERFDRVLARVRDVLDRGDASHRRAALLLLGSAPKDRLAALAPLAVAAFADPDAQVRAAAAWAWPFASTADGDPADLHALGDPDADLRQHALIVVSERLKGTRDAAAARRVAELLRDPDVDVRFRAGNVLESIGAAPADCIEAVRINLRSKVRGVRLGALQAAVVLGPAARPAVPEFLAILGDGGDLGSLAIDALAATGEPDEEIRGRVRAWAAAAGYRASQAARAFGGHAAFLEDLVPPGERDGSVWRERAGDWARSVVADRPVVRAESGDGWDALADGAVRASEGRAALRRIAAETDVPRACAAIAALAVISPVAEAATFARAARSASPELRAAALFGLDAVAAAGGTLPADAGDLAVSAADGTADERAAAFHLGAALERPPEALVRAARATVADLQAPAAVRIGAAGVVAAAGDVTAALSVIRQELAVVPGSFVWMSPPGLQEADMTPALRAWCRAASVVRRMGPAAAPIARDVSWAAVRSAHTLPRLRLFEAIASMGPAAAGSADLLRRAAPGEAVRDPWSGDLDTARARAFAALGVAPDPGR